MTMPLAGTGFLLQLAGLLLIVAVGALIQRWHLPELKVYLLIVLVMVGTSLYLVGGHIRDYWRRRGV